MDIQESRALASWRIVAVEVASIVVGVLIAHSVEVLVEARRDEGIAERARAQLTAELLSNRKVLAEDLRAAVAAQTALQALIDQDAERPKHDVSSSQLPALAGGFTPLHTAAWESAVATQALSYVSYEQATALAGSYEASRAFNSIGDRAAERVESLAIPDNQPAELERCRMALAQRQAMIAAGVSALRQYDQTLAAMRRGPAILPHFRSGDMQD